MIRCYLHLNPDTLTDDEFHIEWARLRYWLIQTKQMQPVGKPTFTDDELKEMQEYEQES